MADDKPKQDQPNTTPQQFEETIKALSDTPPVSNEKVQEWAKKQRDGK